MSDSQTFRKSDPCNPHLAIGGGLAHQEGLTLRLLAKLEAQEPIEDRRQSVVEGILPSVLGFDHAFFEQSELNERVEYAPAEGSTRKRGPSPINGKEAAAESHHGR